MIKKILTGVGMLAIISFTMLFVANDFSLGDQDANIFRSSAARQAQILLNRAANNKGPIIPGLKPQKLFLMSGQSLNGAFKNDVHSTTDGITWTPITAAANWSPRMESTAVFFNNQLWIMSGDNDTGILTDLWSSPNGVTWTLAATLPQFQQVDEAILTVFNGNLLVIDGWSGNIWSSSNGTTWGAPVITAAPWAQRSGFSTAVYKNKLWIIGGAGTTMAYLNDLWTWNGTFPATWVHEDMIPSTIPIDNALWAGRGSAQVVVYKNYLYVIGGDSTSTGGPVWNDIWRWDGTNTWQNVGYVPWGMTAQRGEYRAAAVNDKLMITGGWGFFGGPAYYNKTWIWDGTFPMMWSTYTSSWSPRMGHALVVTPESFGPKPDLIVDSITATGVPCVAVQPPGTICWTQANVSNPLYYLPVDIVIKNIGTAPAVIPSTMGLSKMLQNLSSPVGAGLAITIGQAVTLAPGATYTIQSDSHFNFNPLPLGGYALHAAVDYDGNGGNAVIESSEGNNIGGNQLITVQ